MLISATAFRSSEGSHFVSCHCQAHGSPVGDATAGSVKSLSVCLSFCLRTVDFLWGGGEPTLQENDSSINAEFETAMLTCNSPPPKESQWFQLSHLYVCWWGGVVSTLHENDQQSMLNWKLQFLKTSPPPPRVDIASQHGKICKFPVGQFRVVKPRAFKA